MDKKFSMKKERLVKKYFPVESFDMAGLAEWFTAMSAQGLHLVKLKGVDKAYFRQGEPRPNARYGLEAASVYHIEPERNEAYAEMGWEYVTTLAGLYYVYCTEQPDLPDLHTDPVVQAGTLTKLIRRRTLSQLFLLAYMSFAMWNVFRFSTPWDIPRIFLLQTTGALIFILLWVFWIIGVIPQVRMIFALRRLRHQLEQGIPLDAARRWPRKIPHSVINIIVIALVYLSGAVFFWNGHTAAHPLPDGYSFPHVTLEQALEGSQSELLRLWTPKEMLHTDTVKGSLLVPEQIDWQQEGTVRLPGGKEVRSGVYLDCYRARTAKLAGLLYRCLQRQERQRFDRPEYTLLIEELEDFRTLTHPDFDSLSALTWRTADMEGPRSMYVIQKGTRVLRLYVTPPADARICLDLLAQQLSDQGGAL